MDGPWGNESDRERQILYVLTFLWNLKKAELREMRVESDLPGAWALWNEEALVQGYNLPAIKWLSFENLKTQHGECNL